ncbi:MAG: hypothetical protein M3N53_06405 [Actinomycetota bacterium]|nr:hypothetical protein [Actinomycetota bacterium]
MKRKLALSLLAILMSLPAVAEGGPGAGAFFYADANWFFPTSNPKVLRWYFAIVMGDTGVGPEEFASIGVGRCRVKTNGTGTYLGCVAPELARAKNKDVFDMDPAMQTARLDLEGKDGDSYSVEWAAKPAAYAYRMEEVCDEGTAQTLFVGRPATAKAALGGRELNEPAPWEGYDSTELVRAAGVAACNVGAASDPDGKVRRTFQID